MNITVLGLVCDILGALFLGYDIVVHPWKKNLGDLVKSRSANAHRTYDKLIKDTRQLDRQFFAQSDIDQRIEYLEMRLKESLEDYMEELTPFERHRIGYGAIGILLLIVGFFLQAVGATQ